MFIMSVTWIAGTTFIPALLMKIGQAEVKAADKNRLKKMTINGT